MPNISPNNSNILTPKPGMLPCHYRVSDPAGVTGFIATGTPLSDGSTQGLAMVPFESMKEQWFYFNAVANADQWNANSSIPCPRGVVSAAWMPDDCVDAGDIVMVRVINSQAVRFTTAGGGRNGWLILWTRG